MSPSLKLSPPHARSKQCQWCSAFEEARHFLLPLHLIINLSVTSLNPPWFHQHYALSHVAALVANPWPPSTPPPHFQQTFLSNTAEVTGKHMEISAVTSQGVSKSKLTTRSHHMVLLGSQVSSMKLGRGKFFVISIEIIKYLKLANHLCNMCLGTVCELFCCLPLFTLHI